VPRQARLYVVPLTASGVEHFQVAAVVRSAYSALPLMP
jgi:hypothetical protein